MGWIIGAAVLGTIGVFAYKHGGQRAGGARNPKRLKAPRITRDPETPKERVLGLDLSTGSSTGGPTAMGLLLFMGSLQASGQRDSVYFA